MIKTGRYTPMRNTLAYIFKSAIKTVFPVKRKVYVDLMSRPRRRGGHSLHAHLVVALLVRASARACCECHLICFLTTYIHCCHALHRGLGLVRFDDSATTAYALIMKFLVTPHMKLRLISCCRARLYNIHVRCPFHPYVV